MNLLVYPHLQSAPAKATRARRPVFLSTNTTSTQ